MNKLDKVLKDFIGPIDKVLDKKAGKVILILIMLAIILLVLYIRYW